MKYIYLNPWEEIMGNTENEFQQANLPPGDNKMIEVQTKKPLETPLSWNISLSSCKRLEPLP